MPFLVLVAGSFMLHLIRTRVSFSGKETLLTVLTAVLAFVFGACMNARSSKGDTWIRKMIVMFLFILMILIYLGIVRIDAVSLALNSVGFTDMMYCLLFVWLGFLFFC